MPKSRGSGVAADLLRRLERAARERGWTTIRLETGPGQPDAMRFHEREGYREIPLFGAYAGSDHSVGCRIREMSRTGRGFRPWSMTRYLLIQRYEGGNCEIPMGAWDPADIRRHLRFQQSLDDDLLQAGELIDAQGVSADARRITSDGATTSITVPQGETLLAGYRLIDVETAARAVEIAARSSAAPGPGGRPMELPIEIREALSPGLLS